MLKLSKKLDSRLIRRALSALAVCALSFALTACEELDTPTVAINETNFPNSEVRKYVTDTYDYDKDGWLDQAELMNMRVAEDFWGGIDELPNDKTLAEKVRERKQQGSTSTATSSVEINASTFPDRAFRSYIQQNFDKNSDGILSQSEITNAKSIDCRQRGISDLKGIENLKNLTYLDCSDNSITYLDVSKNTELSTLICKNNRMKGLIVTGNSRLTHLECGSNSLYSLDVTKNSWLEYLNCDKNYISSLDVSHNALLETLSCADNSLDKLDVSQNRALKKLDCSENSITSLDVTQNTKLERLSCDSNRITYLDLSRNTQLSLFAVDYDYSKVKIVV